MAEFSKAHAFTAKWEGGLSDHPSDRGGITKYGVSIKFLQGLAAEQLGRDVLDRMSIRLPITAETVRSLTRDQAEALFRWEFWTPLRMDALPQRSATLLYDMSVNHGAKRAVILAQRGYNACVGPYGKKLEEDGILGPQTRAALTHDTDAIASAIINARRDFYRAIVAQDATQNAHLKGWLNRADDLARTLGV